MSCIFGVLVSGNQRSYTVLENDTHLAFLSIYPNTKGVTVVIPKEHYTSYVFEQPDNVVSDLMNVCKEVAELLDSKLNVGRTALVFEGYGVNHLHAKLFPLHGTSKESWTPIKSNVDTYFEKYVGFLSTNDSKLATDDELQSVLTSIKQ
jgi:diadenosine tetraphosphate (Ap4A) HIT family hydrolase